MNLTEQAHQQIGDHDLSPAQAVHQRCQHAKDCEEKGDYAAAVAALGDLWPRAGQHPPVAHLDTATQAEALLRVGALTGFMGSVQRLDGAQATAKDLLSASAALFALVPDRQKVVEAQTDLAYCYWREGAYDEARVLLHEALAQMGDAQWAQRAIALQRLAIVESSSSRYSDALRLLLEAAPLFEAYPSDAQKGKFHMELAVVYDFLSVGERREDYAERAFVEYTAASVYLEQGGHLPYLAANENNFGFFLYRRGQYAAAHAHLAHARRLFVRLSDHTHVAQVDDTNAHVLLAEGRIKEAARVAGEAVRALERGGQQGLLAEALTTQGTALARAGQSAQAHATLMRAFNVAEQAGELEGAGRAELTLLEELAAQLTPREAQAHYLSADQLLAQMQDPALGARLRAAARQVVGAAGAPVVAQFITEANARHGKRVEFSPAAVAALGRLPFAADAQSLRALVERTVLAAADGSVITAAAVEVVALRQTDRSDLTDPWAEFSFKEEVQRFEERLIEQALKDTRGMVSHAARLLGFRHHETLNWRLKNRNKNLAAARKPVKPRRRSIIRPDARKRA